MAMAVASGEVGLEAARARETAREAAGQGEAQHIHTSRVYDAMHHCSSKLAVSIRLMSGTFRGEQLGLASLPLP